MKHTWIVNPQKTKNVSVQFLFLIIRGIYSHLCYLCRLYEYVLFSKKWMVYPLLKTSMKFRYY